MGAILFIFLVSVDQTNWILQVGSSNMSSWSEFLESFLFLSPWTTSAESSDQRGDPIPMDPQNAVSSKPQIGCPVTLFVNKNSKQF